MAAGSQTISSETTFAELGEHSECLQQRKKEIDVFSGRPQGFAFCPHALGGDYARNNSVALQKKTTTLKINMFRRQIISCFWF